MNKSIYSNVKVGAQKIYKGAKELFIEENLGVNSFNNAVDKVTGEYIKHYGARVSKADEAVEAIKNIKEAGMNSAPETLKMMGREVDKENANKILNASADRMALSTSKLNPDDTGKVYNGFLRKTKGAIAMNTVGNTAKGYYYNPLKDGISNAKAGMSFKTNKDLHKAAARIGATTTLAVGGLSLANNDEEYEDW